MKWTAICIIALVLCVSVLETQARHHHRHHRSRHHDVHRSDDLDEVLKEEAQEEANTEEMLAESPSATAPLAHNDLLSTERVLHHELRDFASAKHAIHLQHKKTPHAHHRIRHHIRHGHSHSHSRNHAHAHSHHGHHGHHGHNHATGHHGHHGHHGHAHGRPHGFRMSAHEEKKEGGAAAGHDAHNWGYTQNGADWGEKCVEGKRQSPVALVSSGVKKAAGEAQTSHEVKFEYPASVSGAKILNNGHTVQVEGANFGKVVFNGANYEVKQFHFHAPAEHTINGKQYSAEMHIVHQKEGAKGKESLLVVGILFDIGAENAFLNQLGWNSLPAKKDENKPLTGAVDLNALTSLKSDIYSYSGSLTTPTCDETVAWNVMTQIETFSEQQAKALSALFADNKDFANGKGNNRAIQALNGRDVLLVSHTTGAAASTTSTTSTSTEEKKTEEKAEEKKSEEKSEEKKEEKKEEQKAEQAEKKEEKKIEQKAVQQAEKKQAEKPVEKKESKQAEEKVGVNTKGMSPEELHNLISQDSVKATEVEPSGDCSEKKSCYTFAN